jgi:hypothetical protein
MTATGLFEVNVTNGLGMKGHCSLLPVVRFLIVYGLFDKPNHIGAVA